MNPKVEGEILEEIQVEIGEGRVPGDKALGGTIKEGVTTEDQIQEDQIQEDQIQEVIHPIKKE